MNIANRITLYRVLAAFLFMICMTIKTLVSQYTALVIFIAAAISDLYDGKMARKMGKVTNLGRIMDPIADKLLITSALIMLVQENIIPAWMTIIIISREFAVMGLRMLASLEQKIISADEHGKYKTAAQLVAVIVILVFMLFQKTMMYAYSRSLEEMLLSGGAPGKYVNILFFNTPYCLMFISMLVTLFSGINYFIQNKNIFLKET
ncbi:CDP-diacylglycerol--glycerol-3-phosphate 3-phosphatidyltransferase [Candidatus Poribacteria bacterium]|nr:CDP-diacylglycerol--glycerol-3-phosphate 3-phosphatidyltransferase [Candidatus Poribacteria bacterium]